jgi:hypothetical protein
MCEKEETKYQCLISNNKDVVCTAAGASARGLNRILNEQEKIAKQKILYLLTNNIRIRK